MTREDPPRSPTSRRLSRPRTGRCRPTRLAALLGLACVLPLGAWALLDRQEVPVRGGIAEYYEDSAVREALGAPEEAERCGLRGGGCSQEFERGVVYWTPAGHTVHLPKGPLLDRYTESGGPDGVFGLPEAPLVRDDPSEGVDQLRTRHPESDERYRLVSAEEGDVVPVEVSGAVGGHWERHREELGPPVAGTTPDGERCSEHGVCRQDFRGGTLLWSARTGVHAVSGAFRDRYEDSMGAPLDEERVNASGVTVQEFTAAGGLTGVMSWTEGNDVDHHSVRGAVAGLYAAAGGARGELGPPLGEEETGLRDGGVRQRFAGGAVYWSPRTGAAAVADPAVAEAWSAQGSEEGPWGYPISGGGELGAGRGPGAGEGLSAGGGSRPGGGPSAGGGSRSGEGPGSGGGRSAARAQDFQGGTAEVSEDGFSRFRPGAALSADPARLFEGVAEGHRLGGARGGVEGLGDGTRVRRFERGVVVLTPADGVVAMDEAVFRAWRERPGATGGPRMSRAEDGRLTTRFSHGDLARVPERGGAVLRVSSALGAGDALVIGDSQLGEGDQGASWVAQAVRRSGYAPHCLARPGVGVAADASRDRFGSYYEGVVDGRWILPGGDPGLVYLQGSGNDSYGTPPAEIREKATRTVQRLREVYPGSRIVMTGLISKHGAASRDRVSEVLERVAREQGALFVPLKGKVTEWGAAPFLRDGLHFRAPEGHDYMAERYAPYLRRLLEG